MKKQFNVSTLCEVLDVSTQYFYKIIKKPIPGLVYDENQINYDELKKFINRKIDAGEIDEDEILGELQIESLDDIEIVRNVRNSNGNASKVTLNELEVGEHYVICSYHHKIEYILRNVLDINDDTIFVFEEVKTSKVTKDKYRCLTADELSEDRFRIEKI